ncbi:peptidase [Rhodococcus hoagii]|nr:peptidase [Prescottella equi]NKR43425.1 peptidase [Prescottella equi]NKR69970.1 peptidase [Prescottella equi]NKS16844.1 peptidase [Prescottella equi]ORJ93231.1 peptidase [Prescottella equi]
MRTVQHPNTLLVRRIASVAVMICSLVSAGSISSIAAAQSSPAQNEGIGVRLLEAPSNNGNDPRARVYIVDHLSPGATISRRFEVANTTGEAADVRLYPSAASIDRGRFIGAAGQVANDLTTWTSITPAQVRVEAHSTTEAVATIAVPQDAPPGEQYGVLWAEVHSSPSPQSPVAQISRVGIRLYVSVGPGNPPAADFAISSLSAGRSDDGTPVLAADVRNTGGRALDLRGSLVLADGPGGLNAGPFAVEGVTSLAPGTTGTVAATLSKDIPAGPWNASVTLESGLIERSAATQITFPDSGRADFAVQESRTRTAALLGIGVLAVIGIGGAVILRRRSTRAAGGA